MTNPKRAYLDKNGDRLYIPLDIRQRNKSVTTFMKVLPKPWLAPWIAKSVAGLAVELMMDEEECGPGHSIIGLNYSDEEGITDYELLAKDLALAADWTRDDAGALGDEVHELAEEILVASKGNPIIARKIWSEECQGERWSDEAIHRCELMLDFLSNHEVEILVVEPTIYNDTFRYAGSADFIA